MKYRILTISEHVLINLYLHPDPPKYVLSKNDRKSLITLVHRVRKNKKVITQDLKLVNELLAKYESDPEFSRKKKKVKE